MLVLLEIQKILKRRITLKVIAEEFGVSIATVKRDWDVAKAWLRTRLDEI